MSYIMVIGAAVASIAIWLFALYREFGTSQDTLRKTEAEKRQKFARAKSAEDETARMKPKRKSRDFGQR